MKTRINGDGWREAIAVALRLMPPPPNVRIVAGVDPIFAGVHTYEFTDDGRSYRDTACCLYPYHVRGYQSDRVTTIVLPRFYRNDIWRNVRTIVHEYGHAFHESLGWDHVACPINDYAARNHHEAFAVAFTAWCWGDIVADADADYFSRLHEL